MRTIKTLIAQASRRLHAVAGARLDCELLLADLLQQERSFLYAHPELQPPKRIIAAYQGRIEARRQGYPAAYLTGRKEFFSLPLAVSRSTLIPRPETEALVEAALARIPPAAEGSLLDLCTGSGAVAIAIATRRPRLIITAADVCAQALAIARQNIHRLGTGNIRTIQSDLFARLAGKRFDYITANPPYVRSDDPCLAADGIRHEPRLALDGGPDGLDVLLGIISRARRQLHQGGALLLEHGRDQGEDLRAAMRLHRYARIQTINDWAGHERVTVAHNGEQAT